MKRSAEIAPRNFSLPLSSSLKMSISSHAVNAPKATKEPTLSQPLDVLGALAHQRLRNALDAFEFCDASGAET